MKNEYFWKNKKNVIHRPTVAQKRRAASWSGRKLPRSVRIPPVIRSAGVTSKAGFQTGQSGGQVASPATARFDSALFIIMSFYLFVGLSKTWKIIVKIRKKDYILNKV